MSEQHDGNVLGGAVGETTQTAAQLATIVASAAQTVARMRARHLEDDRDRDRAATDAERAVLRSEHAAARLAWAPAFERSFPAGASAAEAAGTWAAAQPWVDHDRTAHEAARRAEERLGILYPELLTHYRERLAEGLDRVDAMAAAALGPVDINGATAARALAGDERGEAQVDAAMADVAATASVDEHALGVHDGAAHAAVSDVASARAALLAAQAFPQGLRGALGRAPGAGLQRRQAVRDVHRDRKR